MGLVSLSGVFLGTHPAQLMSKTEEELGSEPSCGRSVCQRVVIDLSVASLESSLDARGG